MVAADADESRQAIGARLVEGAADPVSRVDLLRRHVVVAGTLHVDEVGAFDGRVGEILDQLLKRLLAVSLTTSCGDEDFRAALRKHLAEIVLCIAVAAAARAGVDVRDARVETPVIERDRLLLGAMARRRGAQAEQGNVYAGPPEGAARKGLAGHGYQGRMVTPSPASPAATKTITM